MTEDATPISPNESQEESAPKKRLMTIEIDDESGLVRYVDPQTGELRLLPVLSKELRKERGLAERVEELASSEKKWFALRIVSGKEKKIQERINSEIDQNGWRDFVFQVVVPTEKVYKVRNGKKVMTERNLLPGYILIEALSHKLNGDVAKAISEVPNVIHFLGRETPTPMSLAEAKRLLGVADDTAAAGDVLLEPYLVGETVKIIDGPFAEFVGDVQEVNEEKKKLKVIVKIFGRGTEVELGFMQVEKIG
ncbi:MAG: transcription termination/antitermination protein NusG [Saprospiraceae bacterium]